MKDLFFKILNIITQKILKKNIKDATRNYPAESKKIHSWRKCPEGYYFVRTHTKISKNKIKGTWHEHCAKSPSGKDILTATEIDEISKKPDFLMATPRPSQNDMQIDKIDLDTQNKYDGLIAGWTKYWNEVLQNEIKDAEFLSPNIVKALIASESKFRPSSVGKNSKTVNVGEAQGIAQLTIQTIKILKDLKGELGNHFVELGDRDSFEANKNISAAIRWPFHKRHLLKHRTKRTPSWYEVLEEYNAITNDNSETAKRIRKDLKNYLEKLGETK